MAKVRVGLIGAGTFGRRHLQAMRSIEDLEVAAICDIDKPSVQRTAREYGIRRVYHEYGQMISHEDLDYVDICTPESLHTKPAIEAIERGINVFVEKPIATTLEDAETMTRASKRNHVSMMVGHILRWDPRYSAVKEMVDGEELGRIASVYARRTTPRSLAPTYLTRVGVLPVLGIHDIDLLLWYTGDRVKECFAYSTNLLRYANPDTVVCTLAFAGGTRAALVFSFAVPENGESIGTRMELIAEKCFVQVDTSQRALQVTDQRGLRSRSSTLFPAASGWDVDLGSLHQEIRYFVDCVKNGSRVTMATPQEATEALRVALACQRSAVQGRPLRVG